MEWIDTSDSRSLVGFGYDVAQKILTVHFKETGKYEYFDVPPRVFEELKASDSRGNFILQNVRDVFRFRKVG